LGLFCFVVVRYIRVYIKITDPFMNRFAFAFIALIISIPALAASTEDALRASRSGDYASQWTGI
jgi:hypothetical protein